MRVRIQVVIDADEPGSEVIQEVATLDRGALQPDTLGLTLAEAKTMLQGVQQAVVTHQIAAATAEQAACPDCGRPRAHKGVHTIVVRSLFGTLRLASPRLVHCRCQPHEQRTVSPLAALLPERTTPELVYLEAKFAGLLAYGLTVRLLDEVLPLGRPVHASTVPNHSHEVARRLETELGEEQPMFIEGCQREWDALPRPDLPLTVGLDGGYVHSCQQTSHADGWFEVIAGKSTPADGPATCFAFVQSVDTKPKRRLFEVLTAQGMQMNQQITFLTDGGDTVRALPLYLNPLAEHWFDWFHLAMRVTVMGQYAKSLPLAEEPSRTPAATSAEDDDQDDELDAIITRAEAERVLESIKWYLWHGNVHHALQEIEDLAWQTDAAAEADARHRKLATAVAEFQTSIENNGACIPTDGERYWNGEAITSAVAESTINQVISKRMAKQQQMRWSPAGAHLLLHVRTQVLNDDLRKTFRRWYPGFDRSVEPEAKIAQPPPVLHALAAYPPVALAELRLAVPVQVYTGGRSHAGLQKVARRLFETIAGARLVEVPEATHAVQRAMEVFDRALLAVTDAELGIGQVHQDG